MLAVLSATEFKQVIREQQEGVSTDWVMCSEHVGLCFSRENVQYADKYLVCQLLTDMQAKTQGREYRNAKRKGMGNVEEAKKALGDV